MNFLSPELLFGLLAAALPPLIHLLNRREPKPVPFAAIELLRRAHQRTARRVKLKQWLLIALRSLLLAALAWAMARPYWQPTPEGEAQLSASASGDVLGPQALVIDVSYLMGLKLSDGERLIDRARAHALSVLSDARAEVGLVLVGEGAQSPLGAPSASYATLRERLLSLEPTPSHYPIQEGVLEAYQLLRESDAAAPKRVVVLTSPQRARQALPPPPPELGEVALTAVDLLAGEGAQLNNHALLALKASPAPQRGVDQWRVDVEVANFSDEAMELWPIWVEVEGEVKVRGFVTLRPGETGQKQLYFKASVDQPKQGDTAQEGPARGLKGYVRLGADQLPLDDARPFWLEPSPPTRLLALNGDARPVPQEDELFYLRHALSPAVTGEGRFELRSQPSSGEALDEGELLWPDVIALANVGRVSGALGRQLTRFVERGGGLLLAPGARSEPSSWNSALSGLLARPLRGLRHAGDAALRLQERRAARLSEFKAQHDLLAPFPDPLRSTLARASISRYMLFDPQPQPQSEVVASLSEGSPYLMTRRSGQGRVVTLGGPLDRAWSDLVIKPDFVPFAQQLTRYLTQRGAVESAEGRFGAPLTLSLSGAGPFVALSPQGERVSLSPAPSAGERRWSLSSARPLGHHRVLSAEGEERGRFVVSLQAEVSDLRLKGTSPKAQAQGEAGAGLSARRAERTLLWPFALFGLFVLLALEALALTRRPLTRSPSPFKAR